ncbi:PucR C-terminal helix-turn-helix domain-containing protein [Butyrivibrio sp. ob235]|uniref:PucR family transcriptional regulator n=1 Tax=Butyrivibrio sp. ob235 TaxID=1761780 RepID=UPI0008BE8A83|nr:PucR family transcriptional regulator [Butyrivibrio sp. ob235]SEL26976.1 PucR C-terminal helix-turn-helix domain-containing protein [Butyrivibrio sp. ob235]
MAYISDILDAIEKKYDLKVHGNYQKRHSIDGIRFFNENDANIEHLMPNILYLADYKTFGKAEVYGDILFIGTGQNTPASDSLYIEEELNILELYNLMEDVILAYQNIDVQKRSLFSILHNGYGIDALLQTAYKYLNNPVVVCDSSYGILASFPDVSEDKNLEIKNNRLSVKAKYSEDMEQKKVTERIYHSVYPFAVKLEESDFDWIFESIRIKHAVVGYICVRCNEREHTESDLDLIHSLAQMVSIQLQKDDSYRNPQGIKYDMFLRDLFGRHYDEETAVNQLSLLGIKPKEYYYIIASSFTATSRRLMAYHIYIQQLSTIFSNSVTGIFGNRFITLVSTSKMEAMTPKTEKRLKTFLTMNHMIGTVSYLYDKLSESSAYFSQCQGLLSQRLPVFNESPIIYYRNYYLKHILSSANKESMVRASIHPSIKFMKKHDEEHGTNYISTLETYFDNNRSAPATANALFIHKSTLFYRFDKMKQLFDIRLDDKDALFAYEYSLKLLQ